MKNLAGFASYLAYFFQRPTRNPSRGSAGVCGGSPGEVGSKGSPDNFSPGHHCYLGHTVVLKEYELEVFCQNVSFKWCQNWRKLFEEVKYSCLEMFTNSVIRLIDF